jgi:hypothetical protein
MAEDDVQIRISGREVKLILKYGYPFPEQAELLKPLSDKKGLHEISIGQYWLELIIGDLCRSIREVENYSLQEELDALCDSLEIAIKSGTNRNVV